jgi:hypothetical protein
MTVGTAKVSLIGISPASFRTMLAVRYGVDFPLREELSSEK